MAQTAKSSNRIGSWAFLIGVILALILGILGPLNATWIGILAVIGLIVGLLNVMETEVKSFLFSGVALVIASYFGQSVLGNVSFLSNILDALLAIFVPAMVIVAIKNVFMIARN